MNSARCGTWRFFLAVLLAISIMTLGMLAQVRQQLSQLLSMIQQQQPQAIRSNNTIAAVPMKKNNTRSGVQEKKKQKKKLIDKASTPQSSSAEPVEQESTKKNKATVKLNASDKSKVLKQQHSSLKLKAMEDQRNGSPTKAAQTKKKKQKEPNNTALGTPVNLQEGNSTSQAEEERPNKKSTLYLHVGPPKTGTTFLQTALCEHYEDTDPLLLHDNLVYLGTCPYYHTDTLHSLPEHYLEHQFSSFFPRYENKSWTRDSEYLGMLEWIRRGKYPGRSGRKQVTRLLQERLRSVAKTGLDALIIFEGASCWTESRTQHLAAFVNQWFQVKVLIAYRPLYDWMPSLVNQFNKFHKSWKHGPPEPLDLERGTARALFQALQSHGQHPAGLIRDSYAKYFSQVELIPLHEITAAATATNQSGNQRQADPLLEYLFCRAIPTKNYSCSAVRDGRIGSHGAANPSYPMDYDILAVHAYQKGLLPAKTKKKNHLTREATIQRINHYVESKKSYHERKKTNNTLFFPLICPLNATVRQLEQLSLSMEQRLFPGAETALHKLGFANMLRKRKLCFVDAPKIFENDPWVSFFKSIT